MIRISESFSQEGKPWAHPLLRWAGSKRKLLPVLMAQVPNSINRYIEPFAGSACLFFALHPKAAILGDINEELLNTYSTIKNHPRLVHRRVASWENSKAQYYKLRSFNVNDLTEIERAARFVYLNRYCFNGVYRTNRQGEFNVPRGIHTGKLPNERMFYRCSFAFRNAEFRPGDFENSLCDLKKNDFVYLDPPYASTGRATYGEYGYESFCENDIERIVECLHRIEKKKATFLLSYSNTNRLKKLTRQWFKAELNVRRHIAGFAKHRSTVSEILISNLPINNS